jgi:hypothetical protein
MCRAVRQHRLVPAHTVSSQSLLPLLLTLTCSVLNSTSLGANMLLCVAGLPSQLPAVEHQIEVMPSSVTASQPAHQQSAKEPSHRTTTATAAPSQGIVIFRFWPSLAGKYPSVCMATPLYRLNVGSQVLRTQQLLRIATAAAQPDHMWSQPESQVCAPCCFLQAFFVSLTSSRDVWHAYQPSSAANDSSAVVPPLIPVLKMLQAPCLEQLTPVMH